MSKRVLLLTIITILLLPVLGLAQDEQDEFSLLEKSFEELLDVEITTAGKTAEKIGDIPASVVVITREEIAKYGYMNLTEVLSDVPGLFYTESTLHASLGVRGFWTETQRSVMILLNGVKVPFEIFASYNLKNIPIPVESIDRIEIVRGPMSVIYGGGAFFGVINIITDDADTGNMLAVSGGSEAAGRGFVRFSGSGEDYSFTANASVSQSDGFSYTMSQVTDASLPTMGVTENDRERYRFNDSVSFDISANYKGFFAQAILLDSNYGSELLFPAARVSPQNVRQERYYIGYSGDINEEVSLEVKAGYFDQYSRTDYGWLRSDRYTGWQHYPAKGWEANASINYRPNDDLTVQVGADYRTIYDLVSEFDVPVMGLTNILFSIAEDEEIVTRAVYGQANWRINDQIRLVAGLRLEQMESYDLVGFHNFNLTNEIAYAATYDNDDFQTIPRVALVYSPNADHRIKLLYGKAILHPSFFSDHQNQVNGPDAGALEPEEVVTYELNYIGNVSNNVVLSASFFRNELDNLLVRTHSFDDQGNEVSGEKNQGSMITNGLEVTLKTKWERFGFDVSASYQQTDNESEGMNGVSLGFSPEFLGYFKGYFDVTEKITFAVTGHYVSEMESLWDSLAVNPDGSEGARYGADVDAYLNVGFNLRIKDFINKGTFFNARLSNVFDEEIMYPVNSSSAWSEKGNPGYGRHFLVTMGYSF